MVVLLAAVSVIAQGNDSVRFTRIAPDSAIALGIQERKIIFMDCYADWCGPCKLMDKQVFRGNDSLAKFFNENFVCVKADMTSENSLCYSAKKKYGVEALPTYLFIDPQSDSVIHRAGSFQPVPAMVAIGKVALGRNPISFPAYEREFRQDTAQGKRMPQKRLFEYIRLRASLGLNNTAQVDTFLGRQSDWMDSLSWQVIRSSEKCPPTAVGSKAFNFLLAHRAAFNRKYGGDAVDSVLMHRYAQAMESCIYAKPLPDTVCYAKLREQVADLNAPFSERMPLEYDLTLYERIGKKTGNWNQFFATAHIFIPMYAYDSSANWLNYISWIFYEHATEPDDIAAAVSWSKRSTEIWEDWITVDTYAHLLYKQGKRYQAKKQAKRAIKLAKAHNATHGKDEQYDYSLTEELIKKIKRRE